jgi:hypothetical protein
MREFYDEVERIGDRMGKGAPLNLVQKVDAVVESEFELQEEEDLNEEVFP